MATQVLMPQLGEAVEEATITKWLKSEGDTVEEFDAFVEVNTDKVDTEIPAPISGTLLKIVQPEEGADIKVGMVLAWIGDPGESLFLRGILLPKKMCKLKFKLLDESQIVAATPKANSVPSAPLDIQRDLGFISPIVAKITAEHDINLQHVHGTGLNGGSPRKMY